VQQSSMYCVDMQQLITKSLNNPWKLFLCRLTVKRFPKDKK
jgi:hypothetical protein